VDQELSDGERNIVGMKDLSPGIESPELPCFEDKIDEYLDGEGELVGRTGSEDRFDAIEKFRVQLDLGRVRISKVYGMSLWWSRRKVSLGHRVPGGGREFEHDEELTVM
jgi:hypothetical protein